MKAISFSLFGSNPLYISGALRNAQLAAEIYPGWRCVFYTDRTTPKDVIKTLEAHKAIVRSEPSIMNTMFARFTIVDDPAVERFIVRDCDSRLNARERAAVDEWCESGMPFHTLADHPHHWLPIGGGLWGAVKGVLPPLKPLILKSKFADEPYQRDHSYSKDQAFLARYVWPLMEGRVMRHDSCTRHLYPWARPFPSGCRLGDNRFVGEIFNENDEPHPLHWMQRINHQTT